MSLSVQRLLPLFERERALQHPMVLATVVRTAGPTYTKPGAHLLLTADGEYAGLLSGGCLEGDLAQHGRAALASGSAKLVSYDMGGPDDLLVGLGSGCEGAMDILLQRLDADGDWQPMRRLGAAWAAQRALGLLLVGNSSDPAWPPIASPPSAAQRCWRSCALWRRGSRGSTAAVSCRKPRRASTRWCCGSR